MGFCEGVLILDVVSLLTGCLKESRRMYHTTFKNASDGQFSRLRSIVRIARDVEKSANSAEYYENCPPSPYRIIIVKENYNYDLVDPKMAK